MQRKKKKMVKANSELILKRGVLEEKARRESKYVSNKNAWVK